MPLFTDRPGRSVLVGLGLAVALAWTLALPQAASAAGGRYVFVGGTPREREQVHLALDASLFDWSIVTEQITIRIAPGIDASARPGRISLDADLLDAGTFSWGVVQHEFAHQVDFFVLDEVLRGRLSGLLGGSSWWAAGPRSEHDELTCERFASTLAWAYWPSPKNSMRPTSPHDEAAAAAPGTFRGFLADLLRLPVPTHAELAAATAGLGAVD